MKVGVTGASGFIGQHIVAALRKRGDDVVAIVRDGSALVDCETRIFDFSRPLNLDGVLAGLGGIIHAAAHIPKSYSDPSEARACIEVNALGTLELLLACSRVAVPRVVVISGNVYRSGTLPLAEDSHNNPSAQAPYYLISKAAADLYAQAIVREGQVSVAILRPSAVYGPGLARGVIPSFISKLEAGQRVTIQNAGSYRADTVYVTDVAEACAAAVHSSHSGPVNVGSGTASSIVEIAQVIARRLGAPLALLDVLPADGTSTISGFSPLDITLARSSFGYNPRSLESGIADYITWWRGRK